MPSPISASPPPPSASRPQRWPTWRPAIIPAALITRVARPIIAATSRILTSTKASETPTTSASIEVPSATSTVVQSWREGAGAASPPPRSARSAMLAPTPASSAKAIQ